jgi:hypothetical protein
MKRGLDGTPPAIGLFTTTEDTMTRSNAELRLLPEPHDLEALEGLLDRTMQSISQRAPADGVVDDLMDGLDRTRIELGDDWSRAIAACRAHPLYRVFAADPVTARARAKPRGYAGDAVMIDYIYQGIPMAERFTLGPLGAALFAATTSSSSAVAVRERRHLLTHRRSSRPTARCAICSAGACRSGTTTSSMPRACTTTCRIRSRPG